jgi:chromosome segregation ATPase
MQHLHGHTNEEIGSLDAKNAKLETRLLEMMEQRDKWENDAKFVKEQLKESEKQRHEAGARLEMVQKQVITLETDKAKLLKEMEGKDKLLKGEREVSKVQSGKAVSMLRELEHLRAVKKQFLSLAASLKSGGSSHSDT